MTAAGRLHAALLWTAVAGAAAAPAAQGPPTFRGSVDLVSVGVSVRDHGVPVAGLQTDDFQVRDDGVEQEVLDVSYERLPIDVTVALDISQSVTGAVLDQMRRAVAQLEPDLGAADRLKVLAFNRRIRRVLDFADPRSAASEALNLVSAGGTTSLLDTLAVALVAPAPADRRPLVLFFSDGIDTSSITTRSTIIDLARRSSATIAFVLPASGAPAVGSAARQFYEQIAAETGGVVVAMQPRDDLGPVFTRVLAEFRASYVLHFSPKGVRAGGYHVLDVRVDRRDVSVRARRGYGSDRDP